MNWGLALVRLEIFINDTIDDLFHNVSSRVQKEIYDLSMSYRTAGFIWMGKVLV
jgi:hypothetical protein